MSKIETEADVRAWAVAVVEAKGEKFTALSKGEQFAIAKYIVETSQTGEAKPDNVAIAEAAESLPKAEETETQLLPQGIIPPLSLPESSTPNPVPCKLSPATMTRAYAFHRAGFDVQQAYDRFLEWCNDHPKSKEVMDFSTGHKSVDAAFAYWLGEIITVDVPSQTYAY